MNETGKDLGLTPRKMEIGETIKFDDVIQNQVISEYGEVTLNLFFQNGTAVRKVFSNALAKHLAKNPKSNSVTLVKRLRDGDSQYNIYE